MHFLSAICCMQYFVFMFTDNNCHCRCYKMCLFLLVILSSMGRQFITSFPLLTVSPDGLLLQSSTVADSVSFQFSDGVTESVPCSYIEFAERLVLPQYKNLPDKEVTTLIFKQESLFLLLNTNLIFWYRMVKSNGLKSTLFVASWINQSNWLTTWCSFILWLLYIILMHAHHILIQKSWMMICIGECSHLSFLLIPLHAAFMYLFSCYLSVFWLYRLIGVQKIRLSLPISCSCFQLWKHVYDLILI